MSVIQPHTIQNTSGAAAHESNKPAPCNEHVIAHFVGQLTQGLITTLQKIVNTNQSSQNSIVEALFAQIEANGTLQNLTAASVRAVLNSVNSQVDLIQNLKKEIQKIQEKLNKNLTPSEIDQLKAQLKELQSEYEHALYLEQQAKSDEATREKNNEELKKENQELQKEIAQTTDPKKKKELEKELESNNHKIKDNQSAIAKDEKVVSEEKSSISNVISKLEGIGSANPEVKEALSSLIDLMTQGKSITQSISDFFALLQNMKTQDLELTSELNECSSQINTILDGLDKDKAKIDEVLKELTKNSELGEKEIELLKLMGDLLHQIEHTHHLSTENKKEKSKDFQEELKAQIKAIDLKKS